MSRSLLTPLLALVGLAVLVQWLGPSLLSLDRASIKVEAASTLFVLAAGQTLVVLRGGIDLCAAGTLSLATAIAATRADESFVALLPWLALILGMGIAVGIGNGLLISALQLQPFVVTLATWSIVEGVALVVLPSNGGQVPAAWYDVAHAEVGGIPVSVVLLAAVVAGAVWIRRTRLAARIVAAGSHERAAYVNGVSLLRTNVVAYGLSGLAAAAAGLVYAAQTSAGSPTVGAEFILPAIAAVVIGGASLLGGRGSIVGSIVGAFILTLVGDVVFLLHLASYWQPVASGVVLLAVVVATAISQGSIGRSVVAR